MNPRRWRWSGCAPREWNFRQSRIPGKHSFWPDIRFIASFRSGPMVGRPKTGESVFGPRPWRRWVPGASSATTGIPVVQVVSLAVRCAILNPIRPRIFSSAPMPFSSSFALINRTCPMTIARLRDTAGASAREWRVENFQTGIASGPDRRKLTGVSWHVGGRGCGRWCAQWRLPASFNP